MKADRDKIIFESRQEIIKVQAGLEELLQSDNSKNTEIKRLHGLLDVMTMNW